MKHFILTALVILCANAAIAQVVTAKIVDSKSGEIVPYANISVGSESLISNSEGKFSLQTSDPATTVAVSCMGFISTQTTVAQLETSNYVIRLEPAMYLLEDVSVTRPDPDAIMAKVRQNLAKHYSNSVPVAKDMLFLRSSSDFRPLKMNVEITESTGFSKKGLAQANAEIAAFTSVMKSHPPKEFADILFNYYVPAKQPAKLEVIKATRLKDETRGTSIDDLQKTMTTTLLKHLDSTKYYRIKSGWIGTRDTMTLRKDFHSKKKVKRTELTGIKGKTQMFLTQNNFLADSQLDFVTQSGWYEYTYEGATFLNNDDLVYILNFKPNKGKAKYTGKIYVSSSDFAVVRTDYKLAKGKTEGGINLKWILGIKASENVSNGTTIYKKNASGDGYYLQYAAIETGQYFYVNRPLKFIELAKEEKDVVAFDIKVEGNSTEKTEFLNIARSEVSDSELAKVDEANFKYTVLKRYDPSIWAAYSAIEPLEEMKRFTVPE